MFRHLATVISDRKLETGLHGGRLKFPPTRVTLFIEDEVRKGKEEEKRRGSPPLSLIFAPFGILSSDRGS